MADQKITRDDLQEALAGVQHSVVGRVEEKTQALRSGLVVGGLIVLAIVFLLGRRSGRKKTTLVEIRRL